MPTLVRFFGFLRLFIIFVSNHKLIKDAICLQSYKEYINKTNFPSRVVARFLEMSADYQKVKD